MKKQKNALISKICIIAGVCLLAAAMIVLISWQVTIHISKQQARTRVDTIRELIPEPQGAVLGEKSDNTMPILSIEGTDFVGILEMPKFRSTLPVCADWARLFNQPCRFSGNIYDKTMQIGLTSQKGQYDFYRDITVGDTVLFTDMEGNRYTYTVTNLRYEKHINQETLNRENAALTLFVKNVYSFEYIIVYCDV